MRRTRLLTYLIALITLLTGALVVVAPSASADTAELEIANEAWFGRAKGDDPQANTCIPNDTGFVENADPTLNPALGTVGTPYNTTTTRPCGALSPVDFPAPNSKATGHYVVASAGGQAGDSDAQGDIGWAAFQWDTFEYLGATVDKFIVRLHLGLDRCNNSTTRDTCENQGDTYHGQPQEGLAPPIQACNIIDAWSGEPGPNAWITRPKVSAQCIVPTQNPNNLREFIFDVTSLADSWLEGTGHGFVIRPGTPSKRTDLQPFQMTFSGYYDPGTESAGCNPVGVPQTPVTPLPPPPGGAYPTVDTQTAPAPVGPSSCTRTPPGVLPKVQFAFTPAAEEEFEDFDDLGGDEEIFEDITTGDEGILEAEPDLDVIPTDVGSEELAEDVPVDEAVPVDEVAAPTARPRTRPISNTPFPWIILLLLPLAAVAFWGTGTALGPMGDPVAARRGGVSRVLAERQTAHHGSNTRNLR